MRGAWRALRSLHGHAWSPPIAASPAPVPVLVPVGHHARGGGDSVRLPKTRRERQRCGGRKDEARASTVWWEERRGASVNGVVGGAAHAHTSTWHSVQA